MRYVLSSIFLLTLTSASSGQLRWMETNGPPGGAVPSVCLDSGSRLFIGTEAAGAFESLNEGGIWYPRNTGLTTFHMHEVEASPRGYIFAVTYDVGLSRWYRDDNPRWVLMDTTLTFGVIDALACAANGHVFIGTAQYGILRSKDNGTTWDHPDTGIDPRVKDIPILTASNGSLIALGHYRDSTKRDAYLIYHSMDDGDHWSVIPLAPTASKPTALLTLENGTIFYGDQSGTLCRTTNGGIEWNIVYRDSAHSSIYNVVLSPQNGHLFLRTNFGNLFRSIDSGGSWNWVSADTIGGGIYATAIDAKDTLFVGTDFEGMLRSSDEGATFTTINVQLTASLVYQVAVDRQDNLYAVTGDFAWRSTDRGMTWSNLNFEIGEVLSDPAFAIDSTDALFIGNTSGVWVSRDSGAHWSHSLGPPPKQTTNQCYELAVSSTGNVFAATQFGLFKSTDHGKTWALDTNGFSSPSAAGIVIGRDGNLYAEDGTSDIYRSTDDGFSWNPFVTATGLAAVESTGILFRTSRPNIYRSTDSGASWQQLWVPDSLHPRSSNSILLDSHNKVIAATDSGVYLSNDNGNTWKLESEGLQDPSATRLSAVTRLCEDVRTGLYYAASRGQGVFRSVPNSSVSNDAIPISILHLTNAPNPFRESTVISFALTQQMNVQLELRDVLGSLVWSRELHSLSPGEYNIPLAFDGLACGSYLCVLRTTIGSSAKWVTLIR